MRAWMTAPEGGHPSKWRPNVHILPTGDLRWHDNHTNCWCQPRALQLFLYPVFGGSPIQAGTYLHHAADGRAYTPDMLAVDAPMNRCDHGINLDAAGCWPCMEAANG